jgi:exopolysaccharide biosynthesis polyprenyl glycosylphosphotransferase
MNATERTALLDGLALHDELRATVDDRTLEILDRRRRTAVIKGRGWLVRRLLLAADLGGLLAALVLAEWVITSINGVGLYDTRTETLVVVASLPAWVIVAKLYGLYDHDEERTDHSTADDFTGVFHMVTVCIWLFWVATYVTRLAHPTTTKLVVFWAAAIGFISIGRAGARTLARRNLAYFQNTVIVGAGDVGQLVARKLLHHPEYGINVVGFVDAQPKERRDDLGHLALLGGAERLPAIVRLLDVERVIVAFSNESHEATLDLIRSLKDLDVQIDIVPRLFELVGPNVGLHTIEGLSLVGLPPMDLSRSSKFIKRAVDVALASASLVVLAPLFALIAAAVKINSSGPVFFRQVRMGRGGRPFRIHKFRSMYADAEQRKSEIAHLNRHLVSGGDARMFKVQDDPRVTRVGSWLRRSCLDELPQLIDVVKGEMSLVGPRPLILGEHAHVSDWAERRLALRPGITGFWQVLGGSDIPFQEMTRLDYLYVTDWSLGRDIALIVKTIPAVLRSRGAY